MSALQIIYSGMRPNVQEAVCKTNQLLRNPKFYEKIALVEQFHLANIPSRDIAWLMRNTALRVEVDLYYALSPVMNIDVYDDEEHPDVINMNIWKLERPVASLCNSLLHGCVHAVNARYDQYYFGHGDVNPAGKESTAPYFIGAIGENMISAGSSTYKEDLAHDINRPASHQVRSVLEYCA